MGLACDLVRKASKTAMPDETKHTWPGISSIDAGTAASPPGSGLGALREMPPTRAHNHLAPAPKEGENHDMKSPRAQGAPAVQRASGLTFAVLHTRDVKRAYLSDARPGLRNDEVSKCWRQGRRENNLVVCDRTSKGVLTLTR